MARLDIIRLEGMLFFGHHGARPEEQALGQHLAVDVTLEADLSRARASDRLADTIDYAKVHETVRAVVEGPSRSLIERVADEIAARVLEQYAAQAVTVRVKKPRAPMNGGVMDGVSVEVRVERGHQR